MYFLPTEDDTTRRAIVTRFIHVGMGMEGLQPHHDVHRVSDFTQPAPSMASSAASTSTHGESGERVAFQYLLALGISAPSMYLLDFYPTFWSSKDAPSPLPQSGSYEASAVPFSPSFPLPLAWTLRVAGSVSVFGTWTLCLWFRHDLIGAPVMPWATSNRELFKFAVPLGLTEAIGILNKRLDRFLVVGLFAAAVVAEYEVGAWQFLCRNHSL